MLGIVSSIINYWVYHNIKHYHVSAKKPIEQQWQCKDRWNPWGIGDSSPQFAHKKTWIYLPNQWNHWKTHTFPASRVFSWLNLLRMVLETQDYPVLARDKPFRSKVISRFGNLFPVSELLGNFSHSQDLRPRDQSTKGVWKVKIVLAKPKHMEFYLQIIQLSPIRRGLVQRSWCCSLTNKRRSDWSLIVSTISFDLGAYGGVF